ncbi:hypothetical protein FAGAP_8796 [Fusarium agapanthi]|uniref:Uncharacterized protein n=1 Tax=Fusarium agapanthi TaxID=1803897 RepID=A0A9P5B4Z6_9HYPO|nr:hypothetical protein FAGAP_8796 [Fusarium agapanthi]
MNPNPITESHRELAHRIIDVGGPKGIGENVEECLLPPEVSACFHFIPHRQFAHREDCISVWREILFMMLMNRYKMVYVPATGLDKDDPRRERIGSMASEVADVLNLERLDARGRSGADPGQSVIVLRSQSEQTCSQLLGILKVVLGLLNQSCAHLGILLQVASREPNVYQSFGQPQHLQDDGKRDFNS